MYYSSLNKHDSNKLNFVYSIRVIMYQHYINSDTNVTRDPTGPILDRASGHMSRAGQEVARMWPK